MRVFQGGLTTLVGTLFLSACSAGLSPQFGSEKEAKWAKKVCKDDKVIPESQYLIELSSAALTQRDRFQRGITMAGAGLTGYPGQTVEREVQELEGGQNTMPQAWRLRPQSGEVIVLETNADPYSQSFIAVEIAKSSGTERVRVHPCELIARSFVRSKNGDDLQFSIRRIEEGHHLKPVLVEGGTVREGGSKSCDPKLDSAVTLREGESALVAALTGEIRLGSMAGTHGPQGISNGYRDYNYPELGNFNHGALLAQLNGKIQNALPGVTFQAGDGGCLSFFVNDTDLRNNRGRFNLLLETW
jgi:hypothetical protein